MSCLYSTKMNFLTHRKLYANYEKLIFSLAKTTVKFRNLQISKIINIDHVNTI